MMSDTATQDTVRPWKAGKCTGVPGTCETNGATSWPPRRTGARAGAERRADPRPPPARLQWLAPPDSPCALLLSYRLS